MHAPDIYPLKVVIGYDSFSDGIRTLALIEKLAGALKAQCKLDTQAWRFQSLAAWPTRLEATSAALVADIIVVATHTKDIPKEIKNCIEGWIINHRVRKSLVVCLSAPESNGTQVRSYLQNLAEKAEMDFLSNVGKIQDAIESKVKPRGDVLQNGYSMRALPARGQVTNFQNSWICLNTGDIEKSKP